MCQSCRRPLRSAPVSSKRLQVQALRSGGAGRAAERFFFLALREAEGVFFCGTRVSHSAATALFCRDEQALHFYSRLHFFSRGLHFYCLPKRQADPRRFKESVTPADRLPRRRSRWLDKKLPARPRSAPAREPVSSRWFQPGLPSRTASCSDPDVRGSLWSGPRQGPQAGRTRRFRVRGGSACDSGRNPEQPMGPRKCSGVQPHLRRLPRYRGCAAGQRDGARRQGGTLPAVPTAACSPAVPAPAADR
jgi:hypothetical protein